MRCEISVQDLLDHVTDFLDLDDRFWNSREGKFEWCGSQVNFRKDGEVIFVFVDGEAYVVPRF